MMMKKLITTVFCLTMATCGFALGPNEINFNGIKFYKNNEKTQQNVIISEYEPANGSSSSIVLTHVLDKNDPSAIAEGLKQKKLIDKHLNINGKTNKFSNTISLETYKAEIENYEKKVNKKKLFISGYF